MEVKQIIYKVLSEPHEVFHAFDVLLEEGGGTLEVLQEFCRQANYRLSIVYHDQRSNKMQVRLIKVNPFKPFKFITEKKEDQDRSIGVLIILFLLVICVYLLETHKQIN